MNFILVKFGERRQAILVGILNGRFQWTITNRRLLTRNDQVFLIVIVYLVKF